jgi:NTP pyrophosphatase (non-canonical NTP hydrolase)
MPLDNAKPLGKLATEIADINALNGWFDLDRPFADDIALLHSEISEAYEEVRNGHAPDERYYGPVEFPDGVVNSDGSLALARRKPEGVPSELADVLVRLLDTCYRYGIDIDVVLEEKLRYNRTRGFRHGGKTI